MNVNDLRVLNLLCSRLGIKTLKELEVFKMQQKVTTNKMLLDRLAIYATMTYRKVNTL